MPGWRKGNSAYHLTAFLWLLTAQRLYSTPSFRYNTTQPV
jgi:hypothetical protein